MSKVYLAIFAIVLIAIAGFFFVFSQRQKTPLATSNIPPTSSPAAIQPTTPPAELGAGGSSYTDPNNTFSVLYPSDYTLDTADPIHPRIYKRGESQRPQSEMSDGAMIVFETIPLGGKSLSEWVDTRIKESTADGTSKVIEPKKALTQNAYPGFSYSLQGLGDSTNIILQKDVTSDNAVLITYMVSDPNDTGYQEQVASILSSLQILK